MRGLYSCWETSWGSKEVCSGCFFLDMIYLLDLDEGDDRLLPSWLVLIYGLPAYAIDHGVSGFCN